MQRALLRVAAPVTLRAVHRPRVAAMASSAQTPPPPPTYTLLTLNYTPDILEKRGPYRDAHLQGARDAKTAGKLLMAGALANPVDAGLFVFTPAATEDEIRSFVEGDAYVKAGLVTGWTTRPWMVVVE